jgi:hypothetical protein
MSRVARHLTLPLALAAAATLTLSAVGPGAETPAVAAAAPQSVPSGRDYATAVFHDPWDYSNPSDVLLDVGPSQGLVGPAMTSGGLSFSVTHGGGYLSPLWGGYASEVPIGREGTVASNAINPSTYNRMHLHIYASAFTASALSWTTCVQMTSQCMGTMRFSLYAGWNDIDLPIVRNPATGLAWAGRIQGLRLALTSAGTSSAIRIDSMRIYQASGTSALAWSAPGNLSAALWWTDITGPITATLSQHAGRVANAATSANRLARTNANVAGYPASTYFWSVAANGVKTYIGQTAPSPLPMLDSPSEAGCVDYATRTLGHPWTFTSSRSLIRPANATAFSFTSAGVMTATNAGPVRNDPNISLPLGGAGIDGRVFHRLTFTESYDGAFDLKNAPGGGTHARILWQRPGYVALSQTAPLVTYSGIRTLTVDMAMPASQLTDHAGTAGQRYPFASTTRVTRLRYDPNEDPGARRWHLMSVKLAADCQAAYAATISWHDAQYTAGSTVRIEARTAGGHTYALGSTSEHAGTNTTIVSVRSLPVYTYSVVVYVTNPAGTTASAMSSGPLIIKR